MPERVRLESVTKVYPGGNVALEEVSLEIDAGSFLVLLGPSGSGKTTLLRCLAGVERITGGRIEIGERLVTDGVWHVPPERRGLAMVFQDYALWPHLTATDNVAFALRRHGRGRSGHRHQHRHRHLGRGGTGYGRSRRRREAEETLRHVGLGELGHRYPNELSGGEQQRVALARALVAGTGLILCDEPLSNLDADLRERMRVEISLRVRNAGATTVYITHDQAEAFALGDRIGVLERGRLVQLGTPEEIYASPSSAFVARFTGLAGELEVQIRGGLDREGTVGVEPSGIQLARPLRARIANGRPAAGKALLAIRPTAVALCSPDERRQHLVGRVADVAFRGRGYEHAVDVGGTTRIAGVLAPTRVDRGERVGLQLDPAGCFVFPA
jgi:iron(III) transport system ATP-binding protein